MVEVKSVACFAYTVLLRIYVNQEIQTLMVPEATDTLFRTITAVPSSDLVRLTLALNILQIILKIV